MSIVAEKNGKEFEKLSAGTKQAVCIGVYDIGKETFNYQSEEKTSHKIIILWEVNERIKNGEFAGKRFMVSKKYTLSLNEKANLRKDLESWKGAPFGADVSSFDVEKIIGLNCLLNIAINEAGYPQILSVTPLMDGMPPIVQETEKGYIPEWIKKKIDAKNNPFAEMGITGEEVKDPYMP